MLDGFSGRDVPVGDTTIRAWVRGDGPPVLLLHGFPQTHAMWHRVAPRLAEDFTVVATDLTGYGASGKPAATAGHERHGKRAMARDQVTAMAALGFERFAVVGHDRGARCAYRLALDHPERVARVAVLDVVPTGEVLARVDLAMARGAWWWFFLSAPEPIPERAIAADPDTLLFGANAGLFAPEALAAYREAVADPATVHAMCEDYRAMMGVDREHDAADARRHRTIAAPLLVLWSVRSLVGRGEDPLAVWRRWADDVQGHAIDCGHFLPEEAPEETLAALRAFLSR
jgi:haloacetate dehalogenase